MINRETITLLSANKIARITIMVNHQNGESPKNYQNECNIEQRKCAIQPGERNRDPKGLPLLKRDMIDTIFTYDV